jgi:hypothetical protein
MHSFTSPLRLAPALAALGLVAACSPTAPCSTNPPVGACFDECCVLLGEPTLNASCEYECASGRLVDRCAPSPSCAADGGGSDAGGLDGGGVDAGCALAPEAPTCLGGPCCDASIAAVPSATGCEYVCPAGYALECAPSPTADCTTTFDRPCSEPSDCTLALNDCCAPCGRPELVNFDAILQSEVDAHRAAVCPDPAAEPCPRCPTALNADVGATCGMGRCAGFDVRTMPLSACTTDADCRLRVRECCECGGTLDPWALIAIRADAEPAYADLVCDSDTACAGCAPVYPDAAQAYCATDGHCAVRQL